MKSRERWMLVVTLVVGTLVAGRAGAAEDAYHAWLRNHLLQQYGINGGTWVFGDEEAATVSGYFSCCDVTVDTASVLDQPFSTALSIQVLSHTVQHWERPLIFDPVVPITDGDAMLLAFFARGVTAERGDGYFSSIFELTQPPWTRSTTRFHVLDSDWQLWLVPFAADGDFAVGQGHLTFHLGYQAQAFEIGGIALLNYEDAYTVAELPRTTQDDDYAGRDAGAAWRADAAARIDSLRRATIEVTVVDGAGTPLPEVTIDVDMLAHAFPFGTAFGVPAFLDPLLPTYRQKLEDVTGDGRGVNVVVPSNALKWLEWEDPLDPTDQPGTAAVVTWFRQRGIDVRGHTLVWPKWSQLPDDLFDNRSNLHYVEQRILVHIADETGYPGLRGELADWDVLNEPVHHRTVADLFAGEPGYPTGEEVYGAWFDATVQSDSSAATFVNEYSVLSQSGMDVAVQSAYADLVDLIDAQGARLDGIGMQAHMGTPLTAPETVLEILDDFAVHGKSIKITEYDASGVDETLAADYMRDFLTIVFSHPAVTGFLMWGFWDGDHWLGDSPLFRDDWSVKPSGQAFLDLVYDEWWTNVQAVTDTAGIATASGFLGTYRLEAELDGTSVAQEVVIEAGTNAFTLVLEPPTAGVDDAAAPSVRTRVVGMTPNPFNPSTTIEFEMRRGSHAHVTVHDVHGRLVTTLADRALPAGRSTIVWDGAGEAGTPVSSGAYFLRFRADGIDTTHKITMLK